VPARIAVAAVAVPALVAVLFFCPYWASALLVCAISTLSARELVYAAGLGGETFVALPIAFAVLSSLTPVMGGGDAPLRAALLLALSATAFTRAATLYGTIWSKSAGQIFCVVFAGAVMPGMLADLTRLRMMDEGRVYVLFPFVAAFTTDAGAYFTGLFFGKRHAFPRVSPSKTVEGCVGGALVGIACCLLYAALATRLTAAAFPLSTALPAGIACAVMTQLGDLAFSFVKREYNIKDFGGILPGHGGILDRFDSMVFAAPTAYLIISAALGGASPWFAS
jgi:phosphatidate cytidylyltransferase